MWFWLFMLFMELLIPVIMIVFGKIFMNNAPKDINCFYGYRTTMSMKNKDTWNFAHKYCGKIYFYTGLLLIAITFISLLLCFEKDNDTVGMYGGIIVGIQIIFLIIPIFITELKLKKIFDKNGKKRQ